MISDLRISNMKGRTGREVPNQFILEFEGITYFISYNKVISMKRKGEIYLDEHYYDYSRTTSKYRNQFLGMTTKEIKDKIKNEEIKLCKLNW